MPIYKLITIDNAKWKRIQLLSTGRNYDQNLIVK